MAGWLDAPMLRCSDAWMLGFSSATFQWATCGILNFLVGPGPGGSVAWWLNGSMAWWLGGLGLSQLVNTWRRASSHMDPRIYAISAGWESGGPFGVLVAQALDFVFVNKFRTSFFLTISLNFFLPPYPPVRLGCHRIGQPSAGKTTLRALGTPQFSGFPLCFPFDAARLLQSFGVNLCLNGVLTFKCCFLRLIKWLHTIKKNFLKCFGIYRPTDWAS